MNPGPDRLNEERDWLAEKAEVSLAPSKTPSAPRMSFMIARTDADTSARQCRVPPECGWPLACSEAYAVRVVPGGFFEDQSKVLRQPGRTERVEMLRA
jgi:hypothetical protein